MADAKITTVFRIEGQDGASAAVNSVRGSVQKLGPVLSGVGSLASSEFSKLGQGATLAAGAMNLIPGPLGMVASLGTVAAVAIWNMAKASGDLATKALEASAKQLEVMRGQPKLLADRYGVDKALLDGMQKQTATAEDLSRKLQEIAAEEGKQLQARIKGDAESVASSNALLGSLKAELPALQALVSATRARRQEEERIAQLKGLAIGYSDAIIKAEAEAGAIANNRKRNAAELAVISDKLLEYAAKSDQVNWKILEAERVYNREKASGAGISKESLDNLDAAKRAAAVFAAEEANLNSQVARIENERISLNKKIGGGKAAATVAAKDQADAEREALEIERQRLALSAGIDAADQRTAERAEANAAAAISAQNELAAAKAAAAMAGAEGGLGPIERAEIERQRIVDLDAAKATYANNEVAREAAMATATVNAAAKVDAVERREEQRRKTDAEKRKDQDRDRKQGYMDLANVAVQGAELMGLSEKALWPIKAITAIGQGWLSYTMLMGQNNPVGAAAALAGGLMSAAAFGVGGMSGGGAPTGSGGGAGGGYGSAPGAAANSSQATGPANVTIVVQGGAIMGTAQQVGQYISKAVGSMAGTGMVPAAGV